MDGLRKPIILIADDDPEDQRLTEEALAATGLAKDLRFVGGGEELLDYLHHRGQYSDPVNAPRPTLILLDLNMPRKDGCQALREIKDDPALRSIPITVLSVSQAAIDIQRVYELGASSYLCKPSGFTELLDVMESWSRYWLATAKLPEH
jgi:CheY-like chemotaxis protein